MNNKLPIGTNIKVIVSKNKDKTYRQEHKGAKGIIEKSEISLCMVCYWVKFKNHNSWINECDLIKI